MTILWDAVRFIPFYTKIKDKPFAQLDWKTFYPMALEESLSSYAEYANTCGLVLQSMKFISNG